MNPQPEFIIYTGQLNMNLDLLTVKCKMSGPQAGLKVGGVLFQLSGTPKGRGFGGR